MILERLFSRKWWKTTLLVLIAIAIMIRLGIWQLDRLEQRRVFNNRAATQMAEDPLILSGKAIENDLYNMEYRTVIVQGEYDLDRQVVLRNQDWQGRLGVHILTPLLIDGRESAVLVDRGWIPYEDFTSGKLDLYDVPGQIQIEGVIRRSQSKPTIGGRADHVPDPGEAPLEAWNWINIGDISQQLPYRLLPVYVTALPGSGSPQLPYRSELELDLTEGPHLGYAFQWFIFAAILGIGYPVYIRREETRQALTRIQDEPYIQPGSIQNSSSETDSKGFKRV